MNSVSDLALLSGVAAATWQIVGGWYKFRASKNKRIEQLGPFESLNQVRGAARSTLAVLQAITHLTAAVQCLHPCAQKRVSLYSVLTSASASSRVQVLKAAAAKGDRPTADWGRGATESGHGNVIAGWNTLSADARVGLVDDLIQIALLTGQLGHVKVQQDTRAHPRTHSYSHAIQPTTHAAN